MSAVSPERGTTFFDVQEFDHEDGKIIVDDRRYALPCNAENKYLDADESVSCKEIKNN